MQRRDVLGAAVLAGLAMRRPAAAQPRGYPSQPIRFIVPFTPGGANDVVARLVSDNLAAAWGQPIVVENRAGASGNIGAEAVARAAPDGHTWLLGANQIFTTNPHILRPPFDVLRDFTFVARLVDVQVVLVAHPSVRAGNAGELVELARRQPGTLTYPSSGIGSFQHLGMARLLGEDATHVPYRGATGLLPDLLAGRVTIFVGALNTLLPHIRSGALKALAVMGPSRVLTLPEVPSVTEAGFPDAWANVWLSLVMPAGVPQPIVETVHAASVAAVSTPEARAKLAEQGIDPSPQSPAELTETVQRELASNGELIARLRIRAD